MSVSRPASLPLPPRSRRKSQRVRRAMLVGFALAVGVGVRVRCDATPPPSTPTPAGPSTLTGHLATTSSADGCTGGRAGVTVELDPGARSSVTSASGEFVFDDVLPGVYTLRVEPDCEPIPCYAPGPISFSGDTEITLCYEDCPQMLAVEPAIGVPGTVVDVSGHCYAGVAGRPLQIVFDDTLLAETTVGADGLYATSVIVPLDASVDRSHRIRAVVDGDELALGFFSLQQGPPPCVGDCDGNFAVTVDELVQGVRAALGDPVSCTATDSTGDGTVTVAELIAAVRRALDGCHAADLVPTEARPLRCANSCSALTEPRLFFDVCVENRGDFAAPFFNVEQDGFPGAFAAIAGLAPGEETCVEMPFRGDGSVVVDPYQVVPERDETNNVLPVAVGTFCDVIGPPCTPTQTPLPTPT